MYLFFLHGGYWRADHRLPPPPPTRAAMAPLVITAVIPARNEADILPSCLPSLLTQEYDGLFSVVLVDDDSTDDTAKTAAAIGAEAGWQTTLHPAERGPTADRELVIVRALPTPAGWAGKVWAMSAGVEAVGDDTHYILFTDADIAYQPGTLAELASGTAGEEYAIVSQMALLRASNRWEKLLIPAFVYFFDQLYPFSRISQRRSRTAAAAGGCMLVRAESLDAAGGLDAIRSARIDDVALGKLLKRAGGRCWLGLTTNVLSMRPYDKLADIWDIVARSAYTQLRYSLATTVGVVLGLAWLYLLPPAAAIAGVAWLAAGSSSGTAAWLAAVGLVGWLVMSVTYLPMLRLYRLSPARAPSLPLIAALYAAMTADSARRHYRGRGGEWKGRLIPPRQGGE